MLPTSRIVQEAEAGCTFRRRDQCLYSKGYYFGVQVAKEDTDNVIFEEHISLDPVYHMKDSNRAWKEICDLQGYIVYMHSFRSLLWSKLSQRQSTWNTVLCKFVTMIMINNH